MNMPFVSFRERRSNDVRGYSIMLRQTSADGYVGTCAALRDADFRQATPRIKQPTRVLCGAEDIATPPELGRELAGLIPGAQFSLIDNSAHLPCIEQPEAVGILQMTHPCLKRPMAGRMMQFFREVQIV